MNLTDSETSPSAEPRCPRCGGLMWDNRATKRTPKAADYKCRSRSCDGRIWPERPAPVQPTSESRPCNACDAPAKSRVEIITGQSRLVVCGCCAVKAALRHAAIGERLTIRAFTPPPISLFVAADGWYAPSTVDVRQHQEMLTERSAKFAERVQRVADRQLAVHSHQQAS